MKSAVKILGVNVSTTNMQRASDDIIDAVANKNDVGYVTVTGAHGIIESQNNDEIRAAHNESFLTVPDGMPTVWIGKFYGHRKMERVYGPDLMLSILNKTKNLNLRHYLWGASEETIKALKEVLDERFPTIEIVAAESPPYRDLSDEEELALLKNINQCKPHLFWVGLSTPKQELFMKRFLTKYKQQISTLNHDQGLMMLGVGAAFDFHAGKVKQAPALMQRWGMEWLFRLIVEPKRLWKRYLYIVPTFAVKVVYQIISLKKA